MLLGFGYLYVRCFISFFLKKQKTIDFEIYVIFLPLLKVGLVGLVDQQINFALP